MATYRLLETHELETQDGQRAYLQGDKELEPLGKEGTVVGDGTPYKVRWPTLRMQPLDDEARAMIKKEERRLKLNHATMNPIDALPIGPDDYEQRYIPGLEGVQRRPPRPDGAPIRDPAATVTPLRPRLAQQAPPEPEEDEEEEEPEEPEEEEDEPAPAATPAPPVYNESRARVAQTVPTQTADVGEPLPRYQGPPGGRPFGRAPFGYRYNDNHEKVEDPAQQATITEIRRMKAAHYPVSAMLARLKQLKMYTPERSTIRAFLERERGSSTP